eukprot:6484589-Amphidinium_carterae.1
MKIHMAVLRIFSANKSRLCTMFLLSKEVSNNLVYSPAEKHEARYDLIADLALQCTAVGHFVAFTSQKFKGVNFARGEMTST